MITEDIWQDDMGQGNKAITRADEAADQALSNWVLQAYKNMSKAWRALHNSRWDVR